MGCPHPHGRAGGSEGLPSDVGGRVSADAWSVIASPFLPKYLSSPRCAALHGALYLVGDNTKKVYVYDPGANLWQKVSHPPPRKEQAWAVGPPGQGAGDGACRRKGPEHPPPEDLGPLVTADALSPTHRETCPPPQGGRTRLGQGRSRAGKLRESSSSLPQTRPTRTESPTPGMIKPGRGFLSCFRGKEPALGPPNAPPFLLLPLPPPLPGRGRGLVGAPKPWPLSAFLPEKEEGQCPEPTAASASWASRATGGLCDPLTAAVPWRQCSADRRPP